MVMVYQSLHCITEIEIGEIEQLEKNGTYTRKLRVSGYKGSNSKEEGVFTFIELTLFGETEEDLKIIFK